MITSNPIRSAIRRLLLLAAASSSAYADWAWDPQAPQPSLYQVEAAYLLNFTKFVEWPPSAFASSAADFTICILGDDPFDGALDQLVEGEQVGGRRLKVERLRRPPAAGACQLLYWGAEEKNAPALLEAMEPGVLTISDHPAFLKQGGIIAFVIEDRHVRFDINLKAALKANLSLSARLLSVARSVQR